MHYEIGTVAIIGPRGRPFRLLERHAVAHGEDIFCFLYWGGTCLVCEAPIVSVTGEAPRWFETACEEHIGETPKPPRRRNEAAICEPPAVQRLGAVEALVTDAINNSYADAESARYDDLVALCVGRMPEPETGQRDTRRARIKRAIKNLAGKNGQLELVNGRINFLL